MQDQKLPSSYEKQAKTFGNIGLSKWYQEQDPKHRQQQTVRLCHIQPLCKKETEKASQPVEANSSRPLPVRRKHLADNPAGKGKTL